jgi:hypothetical protein
VDVLYISTNSRDPADYLMSWDERISRRSDTPFDDIEVSSAYSADRDSHEHVAGAVNWNGNLGQCERRMAGARRPGLVKKHRTH